jgi:hypothetical protein
LLLLAITSFLKISDSRSANAADNLTCTLQHSKSECELMCGAPSHSHVCDDAVNQCRSTCGIYNNNNSAIEVLQGLSDALPPNLPLQERLNRSSGPYFQIIIRLKRFGRDLKPRTFSILIPKAGFDQFAPDIGSALERLFETATVAADGMALIQFSLSAASVEKLQDDGDPKQMLNEATVAILRAHPGR